MTVRSPYCSARSARGAAARSPPAQARAARPSRPRRRDPRTAAARRRRGSLRLGLRLGLSPWSCRGFRRIEGRVRLRLLTSRQLSPLGNAQLAPRRTALALPARLPTAGPARRRCQAPPVDRVGTDDPRLRRRAEPPSVTRTTTMTPPSAGATRQATRITPPGSGWAWRTALPSSSATTETASASSADGQRAVSSAASRCRATARRRHGAARPCSTPARGPPWTQLMPPQAPAAKRAVGAWQPDLGDGAATVARP